MNDFPKNLTRDLFYNTELMDKVRKFEAALNHPIRKIPLLKVVNHVETAAADPALITVKAIDAVIQGAEFVEGLWQKCANVVVMTNAKQEVPLVSYTDFKGNRKGLTGASVQEAGGYFDRIELDCSAQRGLYRVKVPVDKTNIRDFGFPIVEESLTAAGQSLADQILQSIIDKYETDVDAGNTDTVANWGNNHYKALVKGVSLIAKNARSYADVILINPDEVYDILILDQFVHANYTALAAKQALNTQMGLAGYLFPNGGIPIYFHPNVTAAKMTIAASQKAVFVGMRQDITIENFNDIINGQEGGIVSAQWDTKSGKNASKTKPTAKAWAVATSA
jgi:hypothetical protein